MVRYILTKFGADWLLFEDATVYTKLDSAIFQVQRQITPDLLVRFVTKSNSSET